MATRTMQPQRDSDGKVVLGLLGPVYEGKCPECDTLNTVEIVGSLLERRGTPQASTTCLHFKRTWRVTADGRIRAEFTASEKRTALRGAVAALLCMILGACAAPAEAPKGERPRFVVSALVDTTAVLQPLDGGATRRVHVDSLSRRVRPRDVVRPCWHATHDLRGHVTYCIQGGR